MNVSMQRSNILSGLTLAFLVSVAALFPWFRGGVPRGVFAGFGVVIASFSLLIILIWPKRFYALPQTDWYLPLGLLLVCCLANVAYSGYRFLSLVSLSSMVIFYLLALLTCMGMRREAQKVALSFSLVLIMGFYAAYGLLQYWGRIPKFYWADEAYLSSRFANSDHFATLVGMAFFLLAGLALRFKARLARAIFIIPLAFLVYILVLTGSRFGWLSFLLTLMVFLVLAFRSRRSSWGKPVFFSVLLVALLSVFIFIVLKKYIMARVEVAVATQFQSLVQRFQIWVGSLRFALGYPLGSGLGTFEYFYPRFQVHSDRFKVGFAHNEYLQFLCEAGIPALACLVWLMRNVFKDAWIKLVKTGEGEDRGLLSGIFSALLIMLLHSLSDFPFHVPADAVTFFLLLGLLCASIYREKPAVGVRQGRRIFLVTLASAIFSLLFFALLFFSERFKARAEEASAKLYWNVALENYQKATVFMPFDARPYEAMGDIYCRRANVLAGERAKEAEEKAGLYLRLALKRCKSQAEAWVNMARIWEKKGVSDKAGEAYRQAVVAFPADGYYHLLLGDYYLKTNAAAQAVGEYYKARRLFIVEERYRPLEKILEDVYAHTKDYRSLRYIIQDDERSHWTLAYFLAERARWEEAGSELDRILELSSGAARKKIEIAEFWQRYGQDEKARAIYSSIPQGSDAYGEAQAGLRHLQDEAR